MTGQVRGKKNKRKECTIVGDSSQSDAGVH